MITVTGSLAFDTIMDFPGKFSIEDVDKEMLNTALTIFDLKGSKKNTLFDALVIVTAKKLNSKLIFSTDDWYTKQGFKLCVSLLP